MTSYAHAEHEARHCVAAWALDPGLRVDSVRVGVHASEEGQMFGTRVSGRPGVGDLVTRLVGWWGDDDLPAGAIWPPPYPPPPNSADGVGIVVERLGLSEELYAAACELAKELVEAPDFQQGVALVARALMISPLIDAEGLEILRNAAGFVEPEPIGV